VKARLKIVVNYLVNCAKISKKASPATNCHLPERRNTVAAMVTIERNDSKYAGRACEDCLRPDAIGLPQRAIGNGVDVSRLQVPHRDLPDDLLWRRFFEGRVVEVAVCGARECSTVFGKVTHGGAQCLSMSAALISVGLGLSAWPSPV